MFIQPTLAALIINYHRLEMESQARNHHLHHGRYPEVQVVTPKIPARVPRSWRRRYLWAK
jgi:hypothetical protein